jgi:RHS repeat-associated protein
LFKLFLNNSSGTLLCSATSTTAIATSFGASPTTLMCNTSANVTLVSTSRFYVWIGANMTTDSSTRIEAVGLTEQRSTTYTRAAASQRVTRTTDALGRQTDYGYDASGNLTSVTHLAGTPDAVTTSWTYEPAFNQLATITDPLGHTTAFTYDEVGRLVTITDPLSHQTAFTYNAAGQPLTIANHLNETVTLAYDRGDLVSIANPLNGTTTGFMDAAGRLLRVTDPLGRTTRYAYDAMNRLTAVTDPMGGQTTFTYDGNANLLTLSDASSHTTTWTYDSMDRAATRVDPLTRTESFLYDENGHVAQVTDRKSQVTTHGYDPLDRLVLTTYHDSSTTARTYDAGDRNTGIADSTGGTITRTYDELDRLISETTPEGTVEYAYDGSGRRSTMAVSGQSPIAYGYDNANRLTSIAQGASTVAFAYDAVNRRTSLTLPNGIVTEYGYDASSHLTGLTYKLAGSPIGGLTYAYDAAGQPTGVGGVWARTNLPRALTSATYDAANQLATFGGGTLTYDANGSLTSEGANSYGWNARNQLTSLSGDTSAGFLYDGAGRRRARTTSGVTTAFLYDGLNPVQERVGGSASANLLTGLTLDEYFTRADATAARQYLTDAVGSTIALADGSGTVQTEYTYEPFGEKSQSGAATTNPYTFTGRETDGTGLSFYRARYYAPRQQRFVSEDPYGFDGSSVNLYAYVNNHPTMATDPYGLQEFITFGAGDILVGNGTKWIAPRSSGARVAESALTKTVKGSPVEIPRLTPVDPKITLPGQQLDPLVELIADILGNLMGGTAGTAVDPRGVPGSPHGPVGPGGPGGGPGISGGALPFGGRKGPVCQPGMTGPCWM